MTYHVQFLLLVLAGWVNRQQQEVIDYLREENRVLRAGLRGKRLRLSDDDRRRLADHVSQHIETLQDRCQQASCWFPRLFASVSGPKHNTDTA